MTVIEKLKLVAKETAMRIENFLVHSWRLKSVLLVGGTVWYILWAYHPFSGSTPAPQHWTILWTIAKLTVGVGLGYIWVWELCPSLDPGKLIADYHKMREELSHLVDLARTAATTEEAAARAAIAHVKALELQAQAEMTKSHLIFAGGLFAILIFVICIW